MITVSYPHLYNYHSSPSCTIPIVHVSIAVAEKQQPFTGHQCLLKVEEHHETSRSRLNSHYVRELTRGKFLIRLQELSQLQMIGQGREETDWERVIHGLNGMWHQH